MSKLAHILEGFFNKKPVIEAAEPDHYAAGVARGIADAAAHREQGTYNSTPPEGLHPEAELGHAAGYNYAHKGTPEKAQKRPDITGEAFKAAKNFHYGYKPEKRLLPGEQGQSEEQVQKNKTLYQDIATHLFPHIKKWISGHRKAKDIPPEDIEKRISAITGDPENSLRRVIAKAFKTDTETGEESPPHKIKKAFVAKILKIPTNKTFKEADTPETTGGKAPVPAKKRLSKWGLVGREGKNIDVRAPERISQSTETAEKAALTKEKRDAEIEEYIKKSIEGEIENYLNKSVKEKRVTGVGSTALSTPEQRHQAKAALLKHFLNDKGEVHPEILKNPKYRLGTKSSNEKYWDDIVKHVESTPHPDTGQPSEIAIRTKSPTKVAFNKRHRVQATIRDYIENHLGLNLEKEKRVSGRGTKFPPVNSSTGLPKTREDFNDEIAQQEKLLALDPKSILTQKVLDKLKREKDRWFNPSAKRKSPGIPRAFTASRIKAIAGKIKEKSPKPGAIEYARLARSVGRNPTSIEHARLEKPYRKYPKFNFGKGRPAEPLPPLPPQPQAESLFNRVIKENIDGLLS